MHRYGAGSRESVSTSSAHNAESIFIAHVGHGTTPHYVPLDFGTVTLRD